MELNGAKRRHRTASDGIARPIVPAPTSSVRLHSNAMICGWTTSAGKDVNPKTTLYLESFGRTLRSPTIVNTWVLWDSGTWGS